MNEYQQQAKDFLTSTNTKIFIDGFRVVEQKDNKNEFGQPLKAVKMYIHLTRGDISQTFDYQGSHVDYLNYTGQIEVHTSRELNGKRYRGLRTDKMTPAKQINAKKEFKDNIPYNFLACVTKCKPDSFESFCSDFGYDDLPLSSYPEVKKIYKAVKEEWLKISTLYTFDELDQLQEIA